jgi:hypothetical protein
MLPYTGMLDPTEMDPPDRPFSYFANPNDLLGAWGAPVASEVTPEGYVYTGFGELLFFTGNPPEPIHARIRTLRQGYLPIVEYDVRRHDVVFAWELCAADLGGPLQGLPLNLARVTVRNDAMEPRAAYLTAAWRFCGPVNTLYTGIADHRFAQRFDLIRADLREGQTAFNPAWHFDWAHDALRRDGRLLYCFPTDPAPAQRTLALFDHGLRLRRYFSGEIEGDVNARQVVDPHTPLGLVTYCLQLEPGAVRTLVFRLPLVPLPDDSTEARQVRQADPDALFRQTAEFWESRVAARAPLHFPEDKVQQYLVANTITNLLAIDQVGDDIIPNVNKFQYHGWYAGGNTTSICRAFEYMGQLDTARRGFLFLHSRQHPDGSFRVQGLPDQLYWEMWGYNLWGWGRHYRLTGDRSFLETVYPGVVRAMAWQAQITQADPLGLWPPATIADDAFLKDCRQTGQHLWGLIGMLNAIAMANAMGRSADAKRFAEQHRRFRAAFDRLLAQQTAQTGGYIPPALERTVQGNDWDNLLTLYPEILFDPCDPRVDATLRTVRARYQEGVLAFTWPTAVSREGEHLTFNEQPGLHYWQTPNNAQASLVRGTAEDQEWAVRELYALLLHTTSTHLPGEFGTIPWSTRECSHVHNILPQGATSAKTIELLRNMLVREQDRDLYLLSAVSPEWLLPGHRLEVREEPTEFGPVSLTVRSETARHTIRLPSCFRAAPARLLLRLPWFLALSDVRLDGCPVTPVNGHLLLAPGAAEVVLTGAFRADTPCLSFARTVDDYKTEYRRRWEHFRRTGTRLP